MERHAVDWAQAQAAENHNNIGVLRAFLGDHAGCPPATAAIRCCTTQITPKRNKQMSHGMDLNFLGDDSYLSQSSQKYSNLNFKYLLGNTSQRQIDCLWNKCISVLVSDVLNSLNLDTQQSKTVITSLSTSLSRLFPRGKAFIHPLWCCWPSCRPCEHPFQAERERDHPSAGLLRIFMTG